MHMEVWVTWLMFRTSQRARIIDAKIKPLLFLFINILKLKLTYPYIQINKYNVDTITLGLSIRLTIIEKS